MTEILLEPKAQDSLDKLPEKDRQQVLRKLQKDVSQNPMHFIEHVEDEDAGKIRIGQYRLFVDYFRETDKLVVRAIRRRSNAYK